MAKDPNEDAGNAGKTSFSRGSYRVPRADPTEALFDDRGDSEFRNTKIIETIRLLQRGKGPEYSLESLLRVGPMIADLADFDPPIDKTVLNTLMSDHSADLEIAVRVLLITGSELLSRLSPMKSWNDALEAVYPSWGNPVSIETVRGNRRYFAVREGEEITAILPVEEIETMRKLPSLTPYTESLDNPSSEQSLEHLAASTPFARGISEKNPELVRHRLRQGTQSALADIRAYNNGEEVGVTAEEYIEGRQNLKLVPPVDMGGKRIVLFKIVSADEGQDPLYLTAQTLAKLDEAARAYYLRTNQITPDSKFPEPEHPIKPPGKILTMRPMRYTSTSGSR